MISIDFEYDSEKFYVAEENYIFLYVCVCKRERDHKFFTSLRSMKVFDSTVCVNESESRPLRRP